MTDGDTPFMENSEGLSLEELGAAFAQVLRREARDAQRMAGTQSAWPVPGEYSGGAPGMELEDANFLGNPSSSSQDRHAGGELLSETLRIDSLESLAQEVDDDSIVPVEPLTILEAMLFVGDPQNIPLRPEKAAVLMRGVSVQEIHQLVSELNNRYKSDACPWHIRLEQDGYYLRLRDEYASVRDVFYGKVRLARLSQSAIDVLALVAYEQPLTADDVNRLRGVQSNAILNQLVQRNLLRVERERRGTRSVAVYFTTERFLDLFALESLEDLPQSEELE